MYKGMYSLFILTHSSAMDNSLIMYITCTLNYFSKLNMNDKHNIVNKF